MGASQDDGPDSDALFRMLQEDPETGPFMLKLGVFTREDLRGLRDEDLCTPFELGQMELLTIEANAIENPHERLRFLTEKWRDEDVPTFLRLHAISLHTKLEKALWRSH